MHYSLYFINTNLSNFFNFSSFSFLSSSSIHWIPRFISDNLHPKIDGGNMGMETCPILSVYNWIMYKKSKTIIHKKESGDTKNQIIRHNPVEKQQKKNCLKVKCPQKFYVQLFEGTSFLRQPLVSSKHFRSFLSPVYFGL